MTALAEIPTIEQPLAPAPEVEQAAAPANPIAIILRLMRGRWLWTIASAIVLAPAFAALGYLGGVRLYESQAILRVYPQESNILYQTGDDSVLKTFDSFVKAETTYVASNPVMERATDQLRGDFPGIAAAMSVSDLGGSIEVRRSDSLIVLKTRSRDAQFAAAKLEAVISSYLDLKSEAEEKRSAVRLQELLQRETQLIGRQREIKREILEVGGEFGLSAISKAHVEKIAQIDSLTSRRAEVTATLVALEAESGAAGADMADQEILRATLLDRALADLSFERAKRQADLATLLTRYSDTAPAVRNTRQQIEVIERAMSERREQIKVLSQTGALTDQSAESAEASIAELRAVLDKVTGQLADVRSEARVLNAKQLELRALEESASEAQALLEETRKALEVIRLEAGRALPGYTVVMSPPSIASEIAEDTGKILAAGGFVAGAGLCLAIAFGLGLTSRRLRYSDELERWTRRIPLISVARGAAVTEDQADRLRNALQLFRLRAPQMVGRARVISVVRLEAGDAAETAIKLAESFARARLNTLLVDADQSTGAVSRRLGLDGAPGWRELVDGIELPPAPREISRGLSVLPIGDPESPGEETVGVHALREAVAKLANGPDVLVIHAGSLATSLTAELSLSVSDLGLAEIRSGDRRALIARWLERLHELPRQGGAIAFGAARSRDPGLRPLDA